MLGQQRHEAGFDWTMLGDIEGARPNLGQMTTVAMYRLMQFTLRDVLISNCGLDTANRLFFQAGKLAGAQLYENMITKNLEFPAFVNELEKVLSDLKIGILRVERADLERLNFTLTVAEDLDCSGLPVCEEETCTYDEGFISGLLEAYAGCPFDVTEVDCWCSGDRVCRFVAKPGAVTGSA